MLSDVDGLDAICATLEQAIKLRTKFDSFSLAKKGGLFSVHIGSEHVRLNLSLPFPSSVVLVANYTIEGAPANPGPTQGQDDASTGKFSVGIELTGLTENSTLEKLACWNGHVNSFLIPYAKDCGNGINAIIGHKNAYAISLPDKEEEKRVREAMPPINDQQRGVMDLSTGMKLVCDYLTRKEIPFEAPKIFYCFSEKTALVRLARMPGVKIAFVQQTKIHNYDGFGNHSAPNVELVNTNRFELKLNGKGYKIHAATCYLVKQFQELRTA